MTAEPVRRGIQFCVAHAGVPADDRHCFRGTLHLRLEYFGHGCRGYRSHGVVPLGQNLLPLGLVQDLHPVQQGLGVCCHRFQDSCQPLRDHLRCGLVEQVCRDYY